MKRKILITGAGSGLGEGAAIGLSQREHDVIAATQTWQQVSALRNKVKELGISLRVEKLDLLDKYEVKQATSQLKKASSEISFHLPLKSSSRSIKAKCTTESFEKNLCAKMQPAHVHST